MRSFLLNICITLATLSFASAFETGSEIIRGKITDENNEALPGITVVIKGTTQGAATDSNGEFELIGLDQGNYTIVISGVGYETQEKTLTLQEGRALQLSIRLSEDMVEMDEIVVKGKSYGREISEQPIQVKSIELKEFQFESADVIDVLDRSAGVRVRQSGGLGSDANIQLNGFTGRSVRIYYDGIPLELLGGGIQVNNLPVNTIERIDVYKGVMPVDVGTDALAGGINVVPKLVQTDYLDASYQFGSFNTHIGALSATKVWGKDWFTSFSGFYNFSDNDYRNDVRNLVVETSTEEEVRVRRFHNQHQSSMANIQVGTSGKSWADQLIYSISYNQRFDEIQHGIRLGNRPIGEAERTRSAFLQSLKYKKVLANEKLDIDYYVNYAWLNNSVDDSTTNLYNWFGEINPMIPLGGGNEIAGRPTRREGNDRSSTQRLTFSYRITPNHILKFSNFYAYQKIVGNDPLGFRITEENIDPNTVPSLLNRLISGFSYEGKWFNKKLETIIFGKIYYFDNQAIQVTQVGGDFIFDSRVSGNDQGYGAGLKYSFTDNIFLRASYERALRIPDGSEVFGDFITIGANFSLRPELSNNLNFGGYFKHDFNDFRYISLEASYFIRDQEDLIRLAPGRNENDLGRFINEAEVDGNGVEVSLSSAPLKGLQIDANFTHQDIVTDGDINTTNTNLIGSPVPNIPVLFYNISARYTRKTPWRSDHNFTLFSYYNFVDEFDVILQGNQRNEDNIIPTQHAIDLGLTYATEKGYSISMQVNNVANEEIFDNFRVPRPGINYSVKLRYELHKF
ncbi:MAG: TonB-dependent receptor [Bacteroidota bacterium]